MVKKKNLYPPSPPFKFCKIILNYFCGLFFGSQQGNTMKVVLALFLLLFPFFLFFSSLFPLPFFSTFTFPPFLPRNPCILVPLILIICAC